jgi:hypothetical protein
MNRNSPLAFLHALCLHADCAPDEQSSAPPDYADVVQPDLADDEATAPGAIPVAGLDTTVRVFLVQDDMSDDVTVVDADISRSLADLTTDDITVVDADLSQRLAAKTRSV